MPNEMWTKVPETNGASPNYLTVVSASLKVPGGTIYRTITDKSSASGGCAISQTFVPDQPAAEPPEVSDEAIRALLSCKDVGSGREALRRLFRSGAAS